MTRQAQTANIRGMGRVGIVIASFVFLTSVVAQTPTPDEALYEAVLLSDAAAATAALEAGADVQYQHNARSLLGWAAQTGDAAIAKLLIDAGADLDHTDSVDQTPLVRAVDVGNLAIVNLLLDAGSAVTNPALPTMAIRRANPEIIRALLDAGTDFNALDEYGNAPLMTLVQFEPDRATEIIAILGEAGADLNVGNGYQTPLFHAAEQDRVDITRALLEAGADPDTRTGGGDYSLFAAAANPEILSLMIDAGADVNVTNKYSETALFAAVDSGSDLAVQALLDAGADVNHRQSSGQTPVGRANALGREDMMALLRSHGGEPAAPEAESTADANPPAVNRPLTDNSDKWPALQLTRTMTGFGGGFSYFSGATIPALLDYYTAELGALGWEATSTMTDNTNYATITYGRNDETMMFSLGLESDSGEVLVSIVPQGVLSAEKLPRYPETEPIYESAAVAIYKTADDVQTVAAKTLSLLTEAGWQVSQDISSTGSRILTLRQGEGTLSVQISVAPAQGGATTIQYGVQM